MAYNIKGECRNTGRTHFKKGYKPWNMGIKTGLVPKSAFKKGQNLGENHPLWKNGHTRKDGYKIIGNDNRLHYEHRLVMEKYLDRKLERHEVIHHIDGNKNNNDIENLRIFENQAAHARYHKTNGRYV